MIDIKSADNYFGYDEAVSEPELATCVEQQTILAPLITVVSASGGVGRSSLALVAAELAARSGIMTSLIECDLQYGDYGFWLGLDDTLPTLGDGADARPIDLGDNLNLYKAPLFPEIADVAAESIIERLPVMRIGCGLAIADAGPFWSGLTAHLLQKSDLVLMVVDQRETSVAGACRALELCARLGVPSTRIVVVYNRWSPKAYLTVNEVRRALGTQDVYCIPDGRQAVDSALSEGDPGELIEAGNPMIRGMRDLLTEILPRVGYLYADAPLRRKGGFFR